MESLCLNCSNLIVSSYKKKFCDSSCAAKFNNRNRKHSENTKRKIKEALQKNYGGACRHQEKAHRNTRDESKWVTSTCHGCGIDFRSYSIHNRKYCSRNCFPAGGLRKGSGRGIKQWYNGMYLRSTYELRFVQYCERNNIEVKPCPFVYVYTWEGKSRKYYPDFIVDGVIIEIKGYHTPQVDAKIAAVTDREIKVLYKADLEKLGC